MPIVPQAYPLNLKEFPDDDDILLDERDLNRKNIVFCRKEILDQMKCTQWAKDEFLAEGLDPENLTQWMHYHMHKCYTPYQDAIGCVLGVQQKEIQNLRNQAGPEGWEAIKARFIRENAPKMGLAKAKQSWEYQTNMKEIHDRARERDGHMFGEVHNNSSTSVINNPSHREVENLFATAKLMELQEAKLKAQNKKPWWKVW